ncbi:MAG: hypothetical protein PHI06_13865, partial [Desulfobulbaceae bacterium]|nr:hypothetical protein [Desulfobulbaceae bacterium]
DAAVKILSLVNQLKYSNKHVSLIFKEATNGTMGYLSRVGFFDYLEGTVEVLPFKPSTSRADTFRGKNSDLIELVDISSSDFDRNIVLRLSNDLLDKVNVDNPNAFKTATYTFLSELIGNVSRHGRSDLNGYMALQTYRSSNRITIAVS